MRSSAKPWLWVGFILSLISGYFLASNRYLLLRSLALFGSANAMWELAGIDQRNHGFWLAKAADAGDTTAMFALGNLASSSNPHEAFGYYHKGANLGNIACMVEMYKIYKYGLLGQARNAVEETRWKNSLDAVEKKRFEAWMKDNHIDREKYIEHRRIAAERDMDYWTEGVFVSRTNPQLAMEHFRKGADFGDVRCMEELRNIYQGGLLGQAKNPIEVNLWQRKIDAIKDRKLDSPRRIDLPVPTPSKSQ